MNHEGARGLRPFLPGLQMIAYDFDTNSGVLWCSRVCSSTDLAFIVTLFRRLDAAVNSIRVYRGDDLTMTYRHDPGTGWTAMPPETVEEIPREESPNT